MVVGQVAAVAPLAEEHPVTGNRIPRWLHHKLTAQDLETIEKAVTEAESKTHAEIVPMIVRSSSVVGQVWLTVTLMLSVVGVLVAFGYRDFLAGENMGWLPVVWLPLSALIAWPLGHQLWAQHAIIPHSDREIQVRRRAWAEFHEAKVGVTAKHTGVLLFVSVMERKALILPDVGVSHVLTDKVCERLVAHLATHLRAGDWGQAFQAAIHEAGEILGKAMPHQAEDRDELGNSVQIKE